MKAADLGLGAFWGGVVIRETMSPPSSCSFIRPYVRRNADERAALVWKMVIIETKEKRLTVVDDKAPQLCNVITTAI